MLLKEIHPQIAKHELPASVARVFHREILPQIPEKQRPAFFQQVSLLKGRNEKHLQLRRFSRLARLIPDHEKAIQNFAIRKEKSG